MEKRNIGVFSRDMTSESLREQVEKRIAELKEQQRELRLLRNSHATDRINALHHRIHELEQVLTLIDEKAKELEEKEFLANPLAAGSTQTSENVVLLSDALALLVGQKRPREKAKA